SSSRRASPDRPPRSAAHSPHHARPRRDRSGCAAAHRVHISLAMSELTVIDAAQLATVSGGGLQQAFEYGTAGAGRRAAAGGAIGTITGGIIGGVGGAAAGGTVVPVIGAVPGWVAGAAGGAVTGGGIGAAAGGALGYLGGFAYGLFQ